MRINWLCGLAVAGVAALGVGEAQAGPIFGGNQLGYELLFSSTTSATNTVIDSTTFPVVSGPDLGDLAPGIANFPNEDDIVIDVFDSVIEFQFQENDTLPTTFDPDGPGPAPAILLDFLGIRLFDIGNAIGDFLSVTIDPTSTANFNSSRISFTDNSIFLNGAGYSMVQGTNLRLNVHATPEPASLTLLALGGVGVLGGGIRRRRKKRAAAA